VLFMGLLWLLVSCLVDHEALGGRGLRCLKCVRQVMGKLVSLMLRQVGEYRAWPGSLRRACRSAGGSS
jgi:hypothetical protein